MIDPELASFLESGVSILYGTRDPLHRPDCGRAVGARVEPGRTEVTVFVPQATSAMALANLRDNGRLAVCFSRTLDHHAIQLKGRMVACSDATEDDRHLVERHRRALVDSYAFVGIPARITLRIRHWPCHAIRMLVETVFVQTPGPGAGAPLEGNGTNAS